MKKILFLCLFFILKYAQAQEIGKISPELNLKTLTNQEYQLSTLKGKVIVLNFWFPNCAPCVKEMPHLSQVLQHFERNNNKENVLFFAISINGTSNFLDVFAKRKKFLYQIVPNGQELAKILDIKEFPTNLIIDKTGKITFAVAGYKDNIKELLIEEIEKALK